jgi:hypothetical protein
MPAVPKKCFYVINQSQGTGLRYGTASEKKTETRISGTMPATCQTALALPIRPDTTAVVTYSPQRSSVAEQVIGERCTPTRAAPASPSDTPSIRSQQTGHDRHKPG